MLSAPSGGQGAGPVACSVEGCHADHVGGVARQVLQLHAELRQEQGSQALCLILELELPEIDLQKGFKGRSARKRKDGRGATWLMCMERKQIIDTL